MTTFTTLPYRHSSTRLASACSIEPICPICFGEDVGTEFDGEKMLGYYDSEDCLVATIVYDENINDDRFELDEFYINEVIVNCCGHRKLSDILKEMFEFIRLEHDSFEAQFNMNVHEDDPSVMFVQEFAEFHTHQDKQMYFTYKV